jgi:hyperosmotically inducible periplasmic protein
MKHVLKIAFHMGVLACLLTLLSALAGAQDSSAQQPAPDNTKMNQRDKNKAEPTADQQKENQPDRELARQIRRSIVQDKSLSSYAHNVKIIAQNGVVTLKGPVRSDEEKTAVEAKASEIAGADKVTSQLEVKPKQ